MQDIHNSCFCQGQGLSLPIICINIWDSKWYTRACRLPQVSGVTCSLLQSICQSFRTTKLQPGLSTYDVKLSNYTHFGAAARLRYTASPLPVPVSTVPMKRIVKAWHSTSQRHESTCLMDVQWCWLSLSVSLFLDCVSWLCQVSKENNEKEASQSKLRPMWDVAGHDKGDLNLPTLYWLRMQVNGSPKQLYIILLRCCSAHAFASNLWLLVLPVFCARTSERALGHIALYDHHVKQTIPTIRKLVYKLYTFQEWLQKQQTSSNIPRNL